MYGDTEGQVRSADHTMQQEGGDEKCPLYMAAAGTWRTLEEDWKGVHFSNSLLDFFFFDKQNKTVCIANGSGATTMKLYALWCQAVPMAILKMYYESGSIIALTGKSGAQWMFSSKNVMAKQFRVNSALPEGKV